LKDSIKEARDLAEVKVKETKERMSKEWKAKKNTLI